jgi:hypothetical protein
MSSCLHLQVLPLAWSPATHAPLNALIAPPGQWSDRPLASSSAASGTEAQARGLAPGRLADALLLLAPASQQIQLDQDIAQLTINWLPWQGSNRC